MVQFEQKQESSSRIPVSERAFVRAPIRARFWREWADQRASRGEGPCVLLKAAKQKVSPGYSPADDSAGSLTPVEMTLRNGLAKREKFKLSHYQLFAGFLELIHLKVYQSIAIVDCHLHLDEYLDSNQTCDLSAFIGAGVIQRENG